MASWINKQKKAAIIALGAEAGLRLYAYHVSTSID